MVFFEVFQTYMTCITLPIQESLDVAGGSIYDNAVKMSHSVDLGEHVKMAPVFHGEARHLLKISHSIGFRGRQTDRIC
jgi:hypothetical protein